MIFTALLMWTMLRIVPAAQFVSYGAQAKRGGEEEPGFLEGLKLLLTQPYLLGIFAIVTIYEIIVTIIDYHFKSTAAAVYLSEADLSSYLSTYATLTGLVSMLCVLFGINNIQRKLGMTASLVLLPVLISIAVLLIKVYPTGLTIAFVIMVFSKAVNYALNQPTLKQLYIPTTKESRYKAQAWIEMFGSRGAKAGSSGVNTFRAVFKSKYGAMAGVNAFLTLSTIISGGFILVWLFSALYIANAYNKAIEIYPECVDAYVNRGFAYNSKGQYDLAIFDYNKVLKINPKHVFAYAFRGIAYNSSIYQEGTHRD
jgi:AAA family ATP:ADP antiporter